MSRINKEQVSAASHRDGHAIVLAGPGTGKTSTLVARHAFLRHDGVLSDQIAAITFTQKAAEELVARLGPNVPQGAWIGTFHGICLRLLKRFHEQARLSRSFKVLDPTAQRDLLHSLGIRWDADDGDLTDMIGRWKDSKISPEAADAEAARRQSSIMRTAAEHYAAYEADLEKRGDLDFADLVARAGHLVASDRTVKEFVRNRLPHTLVDEFQDVNRTQIDLLLAMADCGSTIWAVADDDQALYGWRGADVRYSVAFSTYFKGAKTYKLEVNYRCDPAIIAVANKVIAHNRLRVNKTLRPARAHKPGTALRVAGFENEREEALFIARRAKSYIEAGASASAMAILIRTASLAPVIQQHLEREGVPFTLSGTQSFWDLPEVRALANLLKAIASGRSDPVRKMRGAHDIVETMKGSPPRDCAAAAARIVAANPPPGSSGERAALWSDAAEAAGSLARDYETAEAFSSHVEAMAAAPEQTGGVALTTIHSSKGLEWPHIFIAGCEQNLMPHHRSEDIEEERRLFYVALTRSKGSVDATYARQRFGRAQQHSQFLSEAASAGKSAVQWQTDDIENLEKTVSGPSSKKVVSNLPGKPTVYRRRGGGRSLIPPEEK